MASISARSVPFPALPDALRARFGIAALRLRAYGTEAADLDIDFGDPDLLSLELEILAGCTRAESDAPIPPEFFASLEVSKRTEALLMLAAVSGAPLIEIRLRCSRAACHEAMEVELSVEELRELQRAAEAEGRVATAIGGERILFRRPTGLDQTAWQRRLYADQESAARAIAESLVVEEFRLAFRRLTAYDRAWPDRLNRTMHDGDPLVDFRMQVTCPFCGTQAGYTVNLIETVIRRLRGIQQTLADMVHRLALRYHWSEAEIFAVAPWRRDKYLALIDRDDSL